MILSRLRGRFNRPDSRGLKRGCKSRIKEEEMNMKKLSVFIVPLVIIGIIVLFGCQKTQAPTEAPLDASALEKSEPQTLAKGKTGGAGNSNIAHLYLHEKTCVDPWDIVEDGAWGKMKYNMSGSTFDFVFNGHGLEVGYDYTLIYYCDPWPGDPLTVFGSGIANEDGDVHIMGSVDTGDLPIAEDINAGAKIWLILTDDYDPDLLKMTAWNCAEYLFEFDLITFDDTDVP